ADSKSDLMISGGTDVSWSPPVDYASNVIFPVLSKMGASCSLKTKRRGYYPRGGGVVKCQCSPVKELEPIDYSFKLHEKDLKVVKGISHCAGLPEDIAERQMISARKALEEVFDEVIIDVVASPKNNSQTIGSGITLWLESKNTVIGSSSLGAQGKPAEKVGLNAAETLKKTIENKCPVDQHAADQLLLFMALANGNSSILTKTLTDHSKTNMHVIEKFLPVKFRTEETDYGVLINVEGAGIRNSNF
ncbi:MAG: RNA 3'-terminal phosphate cyclase, partial [Candidatus Diapherotrites archaeon]|nr:RNA 3'-terminal phosphate cyclase [Candidatus Diapherotrites archaeon]